MARGDFSPFRFDGDRRGLLLVHGFAGTPFEMRPLGEALAARGFTVEGVALPGHGSDSTRLRTTTWQEWLAAVEAAFDDLRASCDVVGVCGQSMGGLLTLELVRRRREQVAAFATLAAALRLPAWQARGIRRARDGWLWRRLDVPRLGGSDIADRAMRQANPQLGGMPVAALNQLLDAQDAIGAGLDQIDRPAFLAHARRDHTIPFACLDDLAARLAGPVEKLVLDRSFHVISLDVERGALFDRLGRFFERHLATPGARASGS